MVRGSVLLLAGVLGGSLAVAWVGSVQAIDPPNPSPGPTFPNPQPTPPPPAPIPPTTPFPGPGPTQPPPPSPPPSYTVGEEGTAQLK